MYTVPALFKRTTDAKLATIPIQDGQYIIVTNSVSGDSEYIAYDDNTGRHNFLPVVDVLTVSDLDTITPSVTKLYYVRLTNELYRYVNGAWVCLNSQPTVGQIRYINSVSDLPTVGNSLDLYIITEDKTTYYWDDTDVRYYCVGSDWHNIEIIDANFTEQ